MAHDLMINIFDRLGIKIEGVLIDDKMDNIYYARLLYEVAIMLCNSMQDQATALLLPFEQEHQ